MFTSVQTCFVFFIILNLDMFAWESPCFCHTTVEVEDEDPNWDRLYLKQNQKNNEMIKICYLFTAKNLSTAKARMVYTEPVNDI